MRILKKLIFQFASLFFLWILVFDFQRILFTIHNWTKIKGMSFGDWLGTFFYSIRLDLSASAMLAITPFIFLSIALIWQKTWAKRIFFGVLFFELIIVALIHAGEINAYTEWNHKLTPRVFMHLSNPDEVFRTADYGMTFWFLVYAFLEMAFAWKLSKYLFNIKNENTGEISSVKKVLINSCTISVAVLVSLLFARGGLQQIPINSDASYFSKNYVANDLSVNSTYFFAKSYLLYNRAEKDIFIPNVNEAIAKAELSAFYDYPLQHDTLILDNQRPNIVFILLESWTANAIGSLTGGKSATPHFDALTKQGVLFTNVYATGGTSEIGNASIFGGYPALPEISISMQPEKHRKLPCFNEDLEKWGYSTNYLFSGDLKYGNIGGYFMDHGFDKVEDESDFPSGLKRGKLNFFDEDLYALLLKKMNNLKEPFLQCGFTGSTHSPYDFPQNRKFLKFKGEQGNFMNSLLYADDCLYNFIENCKKETWYKNTIFVLVADHGHASDKLQNPNLTAYFHIPLLLFGEPIKKSYRGKKVHQLGSQTDIVRTLLYQMGGDFERYIWAKDLLNPAAPQFGLHTINRGYGWVTPNGSFTYHMDSKMLFDNHYTPKEFKKETKRCHAMMSLIYNDYKAL
jgi:phosphoglycerol transferase MdoB-like AlkP superfamily enzyme